MGSAIGSVRANRSSRAECPHDALSRPFAAGAFRYVAQGVYTNGPHRGQRCVWKWPKAGAAHDASVYEQDLKAIAKAIWVVERFNAAGIVTNKKITVNQAEVWSGLPGPHGSAPQRVAGRKFLVEPYIQHWRRFNSSSGWYADREVWDAVMQALSHFSYHVSGGAFVLCDLQGGVFRDGAVISDPVIISGARAFGVTDLGDKGIINFFTKHRCTSFCRPEWARPRQTGHYFAAVPATTMHTPPRRRGTVADPPGPLPRPGAEGQRRENPQKTRAGGSFGLPDLKALEA